MILVIGIGGAFIKFGGNFQIQGMALAAVFGVVLNLILPGKPQVDENMFEWKIQMKIVKLHKE